MKDTVNKHTNFKEKIDSIPCLTPINKRKLLKFLLKENVYIEYIVRMGSNIYSCFNKTKHHQLDELFNRTFLWYPVGGRHNTDIFNLEDYIIAKNIEKKFDLKGITWNDISNRWITTVHMDSNYELRSKFIYI